MIVKNKYIYIYIYIYTYICINLLNIKVNKKTITSTSAFIHISILWVSAVKTKNYSSKQIRKLNMEIKSLKLWNVVFYYTLCLLLFFHTVCLHRKKTQKQKKNNNKKNQLQLKGFILSTERNVEIEPCCWKPNPLSGFPFWCIGPPYYWWTVEA